MRTGALVLALGALGAVRLAGQQPVIGPSGQARTCTVKIDSTGRDFVFLKVATRTGPQYQAFAGGGVFGHCTNDPTTTMQADSFAWYPDQNRVAYFLRNVHFRDSTATLASDHLSYWADDERMYAEGNVRTQNLRTRSELRGPNLDYRRARPGLRDTAEMYATLRPTIRFYSSRDSARGDSAEPFVVVADRARMRGNDQMWGGGHVTIDRSDLASTSDSASLDLAAGTGILIGGGPVVEGKGKDHYRLSGVRIQIGLDEAHDIRRVLAQGQGDAIGPDWHLKADTLDMALDSSKVQRAQAWGRTHRPDAVSGSYHVVADSLDIHMPAQVMREMWGYGNGRATDRPDSSVTEDDWMVGDTLHAEFAEADAGRSGRARADTTRAGTPRAIAPRADTSGAAAPSADSTARKKQELRRLTSHGSARAYYHVVDDAHRELPPGINYSRGQRIAIAMREGKVATVDVVGLVDGVYLEPIPPRPASDSTGAAADSARGRPAAAADSSRARTATPVADSTHAPAPATESARVRPPSRATRPRRVPAPPPAPTPGAAAPASARPEEGT